MTKQHLSPSARYNIVNKAKLCESRNCWAMAAILWRKAYDVKKAKACEEILYNLAINPNFNLKQHESLGELQ